MGGKKVCTGKSLYSMHRIQKNMLWGKGIEEGGKGKKKDNFNHGLGRESRKCQGVGKLFEKISSMSLKKKEKRGRDLSDSRDKSNFKHYQGGVLKNEKR